jgi:hypothetical protein
MEFKFLQENGNHAVEQKGLETLSFMIKKMVLWCSLGETAC